MAQRHGITAREVKTSMSTPVTASSGITFAVGRSPVHTVPDGKVNEPILAYSYAEAVRFLGYSDDWENYTLCEAIYAHFQLYSTAPVVFVNVLDPDIFKTHQSAQTVNITDGQATLPYETISATLAVKDSTGTIDYAACTDYEVIYKDNACVIEIVEGGDIPDTAASLKIEYDKLTPAAADQDDIIGGYDVFTNKSGGLELVNAVFPKFALVPDIIIAPGFSHIAEVAAVMAAKAANINSIFKGKALIDVDTDATGTGADYYAAAPAWKTAQNITAKEQILYFPDFVMLGDKKFHQSTHQAALMGQVDTNNGGTPSESPSNKRLQINAAVTANGTEVLLDKAQAEFLNS